MERPGYPPRPQAPPPPIPMEESRLPPKDTSSVSDRYLKLLSIPPPIHPKEPDSPPDSILLDPFGYLNPRTNGTTAEGFRRNKERILVTFWAASPPRVSCFTVHSPGEKPWSSGGMPNILCTEDDLVLLRVPIRSSPDGLLPNEESDYFVYQAGAKNKPPSLQSIPIPSDIRFGDHEVVLLPCRDRDMFFLAAIHRTFIDDQYNMRMFCLLLYNSETGRWISMLTDVDAPQNFRYCITHKVITIGGELGSVGWVDLWHGILICNLLQEDRKLLYIPLPPPLVPKPLEGDPTFLRNIIARKDHIQFFEMHYAGWVSIPGTEFFTLKGWEAATKIMEFSNMDSAKWEEDCTFQFSEVPVNNPDYARVLPNQGPGEGAKLTLERLPACYPALCLHDPGVVYIMSRVDPRVRKASVIAVGMRNKTIEDVADFGSGRPIGHDYTYLQSGISKYLGIWSSTRKGDAGPSGEEEVAVAEGVETAT